MLAAAGAAPAGVRQLDEAITLFPDEPVTVDGTDPFEAVPGPNECSPDRDDGSGDDYTPLRRLKQETGRDNPFVTSEQATVSVELVNRKRQHFRIHISAMTQAPIKAFIQSSSACVERFALNGDIPRVIEPVRLGVILVQAATDATRLTQAQLAAARDALPAAEQTLAEVLRSRGIEPESVVKAAAEAADQQLRAKVDAGELAEDEVALFDTAEAMTLLAEEPGAPFLFAPAELPMTAAALGAELKRDPRRAVAVGIELLNAPQRPEIVWAAFDPLIGNGVVHEYRTRCQTISSVSVTRWAGSVTLRFWRVTTPNPIGTRTANGLTPTPSGMTHDSRPTTRRYDINVRGNQAGSDYSVYSNWVRGIGGC